jgi:transcriptional regulator with XRE-family HTH domain
MGQTDAHNSAIVRKVGRTLEEARLAKGLSLETAAALANLPPEHLRELEEGYPKQGSERTLGPTLTKLKRVANVYGLHVELVSR